MLKRLQNILTYYDSEPTEVLQGLIWFIFAPIVLEATFFPSFWYMGVISLIVGFGTLYSVVYSSLEVRKYFGLAISALSNIRRIQKKIEAEKTEKVKTDLDKMYRDELLSTIKEKQKENFDLRLENIRLNERLQKLN
jgi:hypothetical protein